jgi:peroxiredoxin
MRSDIVPGTVFPDYELSDHAAKRRKLSELQGPHPLVLVLSRGGYCPKDRRQAELLVQLHRELEVAYCRLVTISTDNLTETSEYRTGVGAHWPFLSDPGRMVQKDLDIAEYTDPLHNPMIPHVIVLEPDWSSTRSITLLVLWTSYDGRSPPGPSRCAQEMPSRLGHHHPEMRAAWQESRKELFYPDVKTFAQTLGEQD